MISEQISRLLLQGQKNLQSGESIGIPIEAIIVGDNISADAKALLEPLNLGANPVIVCDDVTKHALGEQLAKTLNADCIILQGKVLPHEKRIVELREKSLNYSGLIAVGSGTINDLCKYTSYLDEKPYVVFGTALSMNGYASANASIETMDGLKKSMPAQLPKAIFLDLKILANAPKRLTASGLADCLCRSTVQADWFMSHLLTGSDYNPIPFEWMHEHEEELIKNSRWLVKGDHNSLIALADSIILSGLAMYICGGSHPASQSEHMIAHAMEMLHGHTMRQSFHGEQIAVTTLTMAKLQEFMLEEKPVLEPKDINEQAILHYFGNNLGHHCLNELKKKQMTKDKTSKINELLDKEWNHIQLRLKSKMVPYKALKKTLEQAEAPTRPEDISWDKETYKSVVKHALLTRDRFTFLDLAYYSGRLDGFLETL